MQFGRLFLPDEFEARMQFIQVDVAELRSASTCRSVQHPLFSAVGVNRIENATLRTNVVKFDAILLRQEFCYVFPGAYVHTEQ